jgi:hypothetical protein
MDDFETNNILSKLPPRVAVRGGPVTVDTSKTLVEAYIRDVVERVDVLEEAAVTPLMSQLADAGVPHPVSLSDLKALKLPPGLKRLPRVYARLLKTLNGEHLPLVNADQVKVAARRERVVQESRGGWGSGDALSLYSTYTFKLLLQSVGVPDEVLPPCKSVPPSTRKLIDEAWSMAHA